MATRRVVTSINAAGKSYFLHDGPTPGVLDMGRAIDEEIWIDDAGDQDRGASSDSAKRDVFRLEPPANGSLLTVFTFMPHRETIEITEAHLAASQRFDTGDALEKDNPGMHTTRTIDYGIVLSGEIWLELDEGEVHLKSGDVVVQRGTRHRWKNTSDEPCSMAFILVGSPNYRL